MKHRIWITAAALVISIGGVPLQAAEPTQPGTGFLTVRDLNHDLNHDRNRSHHRRHRQPPADPNIVRKRGAYGQGFQYGRSVNNELGDIIIWSPAPVSGYGGQFRAPRGSGTASRVMDVPPARQSAPPRQR